jgi:hypothetical protein
MSTESIPIPKPSTGRGLFWLGLFLGICPLIMNGVQMGVLNKLNLKPWYLPIMVTLGAAVMALAIAKKRTIPRIIGFCFLVLLAAFSWAMLTVLSKLPDYKGPNTSEKFPAFVASLTNGEPITDKEFVQGQPTALVFFRGHW